MIAGIRAIQKTRRNIAAQIVRRDAVDTRRDVQSVAADGEIARIFGNDERVARTGGVDEVNSCGRNADDQRVAVPCQRGHRLCNRKTADDVGEI